jgi:hypothetical protein
MTDITPIRSRQAPNNNIPFLPALESRKIPHGRLPMTADIPGSISLSAKISNMTLCLENNPGISPCHLFRWDDMTSCASPVITAMPFLFATSVSNVTRPFSGSQPVILTRAVTSSPGLTGARNRNFWLK